MKKRLFAILMTLVLLLLLIPAAVLADDAAAETTAVSSGTCGANLTWTLDTAGTLTISGTGLMDNYCSVNSDSEAKYPDWYADRASIKKVVIVSGVSGIGVGAFTDCANLTDVTIPDSVVVLGDSAFYSCSSLQSIAIPDGITDLPSYVFEGTGLTSVTIPDSVKQIGPYAFAGCTWLTSVTIPSSVTTIEACAFSGCATLTGITIPESVTEIQFGAFQNCYSLQEITLPSGLTRIYEETFWRCNDLTSVTIPNQVTSIDQNAFKGCSNLESVTIPASVQTIGLDAFSGCSGLKTASYTGTDEQKNAITFETGNYLLQAALGLSVTASGTCGDNLTWALDEDGTLTISGTGTMPEDVSYYASVSANTIWYDCRPSIKKVIIESGVTNIGMHAFDSCANLTEVTIPNTVTTIGAGAFENCSSLTGVNIPDSVTSIDNCAFENCSSLSSVILPAAGTIGSGAFQNCDALTAVVIPSGIIEIGECAFADCDNLGSIQVSTDNTAYMSAGGVLYSRDGKTLICCPAGMKGAFDIPSYVETIGDSAFRGCEKLTAIKIPEGVTTIGLTAFASCTGLTVITIPASVTSIGQMFPYENSGMPFGGCTGLKSIEVAADSASFKSVNGVLYNKYMTDLICCPGGFEGILHIPDDVSCIGDSACNGCSSLTGVIIPASVTAIEDFAFTGCTGLKDVWYGSTEVKWEDIRVTQTDDSNYLLLEANMHYNYMTASPFVDVKDSSEYYYEPVLWAVNNKIVYGIDDTRFAPLSTCTRAQVVAFLYRMEGEPTVTGENPFTDVQETDWFYDAVLWGYEKNIVYGMTDTTFEPYASVTRAQFITFLHRYAGEPIATGTNPFGDVKTDDWYYDAVAWGAENGIVYGVADKQFAPLQNCTRGQVVSFIYRYKVG